MSAVAGPAVRRKMKRQVRIPVQLNLLLRRLEAISAELALLMAVKGMASGPWPSRQIGSTILSGVGI